MEFIVKDVTLPDASYIGTITSYTELLIINRIMTIPSDDINRIWSKLKSLQAGNSFLHKEWAFKRVQ